VLYVCATVYEQGDNDVIPSTVANADILEARNVDVVGVQRHGWGTESPGRNPP